MRPIGGYFELELQDRGSFPHDDGLLVNSGRNALECLLLGLAPVSRVHVPIYTCEVVLEPLERLGIPYSFYRISSDLEIAEMPEIGEGEYLIANNYFGIKDAYIENLCKQLRGKIIVDNSQALYSPAYGGEPAFYSPRKFVGVPDGGIACNAGCSEANITECDESWDRCSHLLKRHDLGAEGGYADFHENTSKLIGMPLRHMSELTRAMLRSIDFEAVRSRRLSNYAMLRQALQATNLLHTPPADALSCPMAYPYHTADPELRKRLIADKVFVATYWPNVKEWAAPGSKEYELAANVLPLPIDQRYGPEDMQRMIGLITGKQ